MKSTKIIGLTGGIGSGKSVVSQELKKVGITVYIADIEAKILMQTNDDVMRAIRDTFGTDIYIDGVLQTKVLADKVFKDKAELAKLNAIVHPAVRQDLKRFVNLSQKPYIVAENAILFESGFDALCDFIVCVTAPLEVRVDRVMKRDRVERQQVLDRINNQWSDDEKKALSDYVIENIDWDKTILQTKCLIEALNTRFI